MLETILQYLIDAYTANPLAQMIWAIGFLVSIYNFTFCENRKFIIVTAIASVAFGFHYYSLWLIAAASVNIFDVIKNLLSLKYEKNLWLVIWFSIIYIIMGVFTHTWEFISIIPTITGIASTYLVFYVRWIWLNIWFLFIIALWMVYNYLWNSIGWLSTDIFLLWFGLLWILRQILKNNKK